MTKTISDCNKTMALIRILASPICQRKIFPRDDIHNLNILTITFIQVEMIIRFESLLIIIPNGKRIQFCSILFQTIDDKRYISFVISQAIQISFAFFNLFESKDYFHGLFR